MSTQKHQVELTAVPIRSGEPGLHIQIDVEQEWRSIHDNGEDKMEES